MATEPLESGSEKAPESATEDSQTQSTPAAGEPKAPGNGIPLNPNLSMSLNKNLNPHLNLNPKLRLNEYDDMDLSTAENEPGCTAVGPGSFSLYSSVRKALIQVAEKRGWVTSAVDFIRVANLEGERRIWICPTDSNDPARIPIRKNRGKYAVTLSRYLKKWKLTLPSHERRWYDILHDTENKSPIGPALYIDLDRPRDWRRLSSTTPAQQSAAGSARPRRQAPTVDIIDQEEPAE